MRNQSLEWFRLDDGVMGGQSETRHQSVVKEGGSTCLLFSGTINTNGGGFASIRTRLQHQNILYPYNALKLRLKGDGKTYKFFMTDGS